MAQNMNNKGYRCVSMCVCVWMSVVSEQQKYYRALYKKCYIKVTIYLVVVHVPAAMWHLWNVELRVEAIIL